MDTIKKQFILSDLLIDLTDIQESDLESFSESIYIENYITSGDYGIIKCHDGQFVRFWKSRFKHAFYTSKNFQLSSEKQILDKRRVERINWIGLLIRGEILNSACWMVKQNLVKRLYTIAPKGYVVWLELHKEGFWTFSTAYVADASYIHRITRGQKRVWKNKAA